jgi:transcriptional regulator with XRE-family HTH domain
MEKNKLFVARKSKGFSQLQIAEKLHMDNSCYQRREKGLTKIHITEWEKLAEILEVPLNEIFEPEDNHMFICKDSASGNYQGINIYTIPESLLESQQKLIKKMEEEIAELKAFVVSKNK